MKTDKFAINWQNFVQILLQLKFAFMFVIPLDCLAARWHKASKDTRRANQI